MKKQKKPIPPADAEPVIKKQPLLKRLLFGPERPDLSELEAGSTTILDILSPTAIDTKSRDYIVVDGVFHAYLYITGYGYSTTVGSCWLAPLVEAGEGVNVSFSFTRQNREKILSKIAQTTMLNRSRMRDVGDTRQDYEELDSAITSGLYLKDVMNRQGEDFYYMHTLIEVVADDPDTPEFCVISCSDDFQQALQIPGPWVLKPNYEGSSSGIVYVDNQCSLLNRANDLLRNYNQPVLCEHYIAGREANVSVLYDGAKTKILGAVEVIRKSGSPIHIFSAEDKYSGTCTKIDAHFQEETLSLMHQNAKKIHRHLSCRDYSRTDFRIDSEGTPYFLELNPAPGLGEDDSFTLCCSCHGYEPDWVLEQIVYNVVAHTAGASTYS